MPPRAKTWYLHARLHDGADYIKWPGLFEFVVSANGRTISGRRVGEASWQAFQTYLLGQVFSYALIKLGIEPLHATVVVIDDAAVAFLGDTGYGKSSLGAALLKMGHAVLTDDLLVVKGVGESFQAYPGPPRIKLFPKTARRLLGDQVVGARMNPLTTKAIISLKPGQSCREPKRLTAIYVLQPPRGTSRGNRVLIRRRSQRRGLLDLISNTFNTTVVHADRLAQQFSSATRLAQSVPIKSLSYPRTLSRFPEITATICADLSR